MEKIKKTPSSIIFSKQLRGKEKILFTLTPVKIFESLLCFALSFARVFSFMSPFGISFYASVFKIEFPAYAYRAGFVKKRKFMVKHHIAHTYYCDFCRERKNVFKNIHKINSCIFMFFCIGTCVSSDFVIFFL